MAKSEVDNRIQFPSTEVDFNNVVGIANQTHDSFPAPGQQPRYDWMRLVIIGLLSNQSSNNPPTQYRTGTTWYNRVKQSMFVWDGSAFASLATHIALMESTDGSVLSLADWFILVQDKLTSLQPKLTFGGRSERDGAQSIPVPLSIQEAISDVYELLHPIVYKNGLLIDPRFSSFSTGCSSSIELRGDVSLDEGDRFTVMIERIDQIHSDDVVIS
jgi:hypothetical protein